VLGRSLWSARTTATLAGVFALLALLLAATGVHAVVSETVEQRRRELGIRIALGACGRDLLRLVLGRGMAEVLAGVAADALWPP
jgi:putative ABC transport system permease protein